MGKAKKTKKKTIKEQVSTNGVDESVRRNTSEKEDCTISTVNDLNGTNQIQDVHALQEQLEAANNYIAQLECEKGQFRDQLGKAFDTIKSQEKYIQKTLQELFTSQTDLEKKEKELQTAQQKLGAVSKEKKQLHNRELELQRISDFTKETQQQS